MLCWFVHILGGGLWLCVRSSFFFLAGEINFRVINFGWKYIWWQYWWWLPWSDGGWWLCVRSSFFLAAGEPRCCDVILPEKGFQRPSVLSKCDDANVLIQGQNNDKIILKFLIYCCIISAIPNYIIWYPTPNLMFNCTGWTGSPTNKLLLFFDCQPSAFRFPIFCFFASSAVYFWLLLAIWTIFATSK